MFRTVLILSVCWTFDKYLSDETDEYGLKKCRPDSFEIFKKAGADKSQELMLQYEESISVIHSYLSKGFRL